MLSYEYAVFSLADLGSAIGLKGSELLRELQNKGVLNEYGTATDKKYYPYMEVDYKRSRRYTMVSYYINLLKFVIDDFDETDIEKLKEIYKKIEIFTLTKNRYYKKYNEMYYETDLDFDNNDIKNHPMFHKSKDLRRMLISNKEEKFDKNNKKIFSYFIRKMNMLERKTAYELKLKKDNENNIVKIDLNFIKNKDKTEFIDYIDNCDLIVYKRNIKEIAEQIKITIKSKYKKSEEVQKFIKDFIDEYPQYFMEF